MQIRGQENARSLLKLSTHKNTQNYTYMQIQKNPSYTFNT